jgi:hypothetical protein
MQLPLEIAFHGVAPSPWAEQEIRERVAHLQRIYGRLVSCRVARRPHQAQNPASLRPMGQARPGCPLLRDQGHHNRGAERHHPPPAEASDEPPMRFGAVGVRSQLVVEAPGDEKALLGPRTP